MDGIIRDLLIVFVPENVVLIETFVSRGRVEGTLNVSSGDPLFPPQPGTFNGRMDGPWNVEFNGWINRWFYLCLSSQS